MTRIMTFVAITLALVTGASAADGWIAGRNGNGPFLAYGPAAGGDAVIFIGCHAPGEVRPYVVFQLGNPHILANGHVLIRVSGGPRPASFEGDYRDEMGGVGFTFDPERTDILNRIAEGRRLIVQSGNSRIAISTRGYEAQLRRFKMQCYR